MAEKPLVLVVDDDDKLRSILRMKLEAAGFAVHEAANGKDGLVRVLEILEHDSARKEPPALIVMDVRMPVMSGTEAVTALKEDPALRGIPVLFLSAFGEGELDRAWIDQKFARELGAVDYMKKTSSLADIVSRIRALTHG